MAAATARNGSSAWAAGPPPNRQEAVPKEIVDHPFMAKHRSDQMLEVRIEKFDQRLGMHGGRQ